MSADNQRIAIVVILIAFLVALLVITADIMRQHPAIPWFIFGMAVIVAVEGLVYLVIRFVKDIRERRT